MAALPMARWDGDGSPVKGDRDEFIAAFDDAHPDLKRAVEAAEDVTVWPIFDRPRNDTWHKWPRGADGRCLPCGASIHGGRRLGGHRGRRDPRPLHRRIRRSRHGLRALHDDPHPACRRYPADFHRQFSGCMARPRPTGSSAMMPAPCRSTEPFRGPMSELAAIARRHPTGADEGERDLVGYGATPPDPRWPERREIAVNISLNYRSVAASPRCVNGDAVSEGMLNDIGVPTKRAFAFRWSESVFEYGSRRGAWRILDILDRFKRTGQHSRRRAGDGAESGTGEGLRRARPRDGQPWLSLDRLLPCG